MNWARDIVEGADPRRLALVERSRDGRRREWTFGEVAREARALAARLDELGVRRGDVVLTLVGNRPEWVLAMVACFRIGAVVLPCTEQLRARDLRQRLDAAAPRSHGAMKALRADLLQPLAAVHHTSSPGRASSQCSACSCWPVR